MANKLTSEGLTVGSSTLTNIVRDWGGGSIFCGFTEVQIEDVEVTSLPDVGVGEYRFLRFMGSDLGKGYFAYSVYLPSGGEYLWAHGPFNRFKSMILGPGGLPFLPNDYNPYCGKSSGGTHIYDTEKTSGSSRMVFYFRLS